MATYEQTELFNMPASAPPAAPAVAPATSRNQRRSNGIVDEPKMFMSANEIRAKYQPLDRDRDIVLDHDEYAMAAGPNTFARSFDLPGTLGSDDDPIDFAEIRDYGTKDRSGATAGFGTEWAEQRARRNTRALLRRGMLEDDDQLWERKADEASYAYKPALQDQIEEHGVKKPVHLMYETGSMGKPQVGGGHHRIAASGDVDGDRLMPVLHHEDWNEIINMRTVPSSSSYRYH